MTNDDNRFGVLLFNGAWDELGPALEPYVQNGPVGKYLYCKNFEIIGAFAQLTFTPDQTGQRINDEMSVWIPSNFIKSVAMSTEANDRAIGFI